MKDIKKWLLTFLIGVLVALTSNYIIQNYPGENQKIKTNGVYVFEQPNNGNSISLKYPPHYLRFYDNGLVVSSTRNSNLEWIRDSLSIKTKGFTYNTFEIDDGKLQFTLIDDKRTGNTKDPRDIIKWGSPIDRINSRHRIYTKNAEFGNFVGKIKGDRLFLKNISWSDSEREYYYIEISSFAL